MKVSQSRWCAGLAEAEADCADNLELLKRDVLNEEELLKAQRGQYG